MDDYRWHATAYYRFDDDLIEVEHDLVELSELAQLIEKGPHWDTITKIEVIRVNHIDDPGLTVDRAERL